MVTIYRKQDSIQSFSEEDQAFYLDPKVRVKRLGCSVFLRK